MIQTTTHNNGQVFKTIHQVDTSTFDGCMYRIGRSFAKTDHVLCFQDQDTKSPATVKKHNVIKVILIIKHLQIPLVGFSPAELTSGQLTDTFHLQMSSKHWERGSSLFLPCQPWCLCAFDQRKCIICHHEVKTSQTCSRGQIR